MVEIFGKYYYIDVDSISESCKTGKKIQDDSGNDTAEINIFKYDLLKICIERLLNEYEQTDDEIPVFAQGNTSVSFRIAFNTLLKNKILIEENIDIDTYE